MDYIDYTYYINCYNGTLSAEDFNCSLLPACAIIDNITFGRLRHMHQISSDIKNAVCAILDEYHNCARVSHSIKSEKTGDVSVTYENRLTEPKYWDIAQRYIIRQELLFRGVN